MKLHKKGDLQSRISNHFTIFCIWSCLVWVSLTTHDKLQENFWWMITWHTCSLKPSLSEKSVLTHAYYYDTVEQLLYTTRSTRTLTNKRARPAATKKRPMWSDLVYFLVVFFPHFYHSKVIYQYRKQVGSRFTTHTTKYECPFPCKLGIWYKHTHISFAFEYAVKQIIAGLELVTSGLLLMFLQKPAEAH